MPRTALITKPTAIAVAFVGGIFLVALTAVAYDAIWQTAHAAYGAAHVYTEWGMAAGWFQGDGSAISANRTEVRGIVIGVLAGTGLLASGLYGVRTCALSWRSVRVALGR